MGPPFNDMRTMNKVALCSVSALALITASAHAQDDFVVIKDTRQYMQFTSSVRGPEGCTMPKDLDRPNPDNANECRVVRGKLTTSGELVTRSSSLGLCVRTEFSGGSKRLGGDPSAELVPEQAWKEQTYMCDATGGRVG